MALSRAQQRGVDQLRAAIKWSEENSFSELSRTAWAEADLVDLAERQGVVFRDYPAKVRRRMAAVGQALPDGCLSADTLIETEKGPKAIASLIGPQRLLTDHGWVDGEIGRFGRSLLMEVVLTKSGERRTVLATPNHRWYLSDGRVVVTERLLGAKIGDHAVEADGLDPASDSIAAMTNETAYASGGVVMVEHERRPVSSVAALATAGGYPLAQSAPTSLADDHPLEVIMGDAVLALEGAVPTGKPSLVANHDIRSGAGGSIAHAELAVCAPTLVPHVEVGMWPFGLAGAADHGSSVVRRDTSRVAGTGHGRDTIQSWEVASVGWTDLIEDVYCAVVPGLHRFVLAGGILTGNSFPIANCSDAEDAIRSQGRAAPEKRPKVRAHIRKRVRALNCSGSIFDPYK